MGGKENQTYLKLKLKTVCIVNDSQKFSYTVNLNWN